MTVNEDYAARQIDPMTALEDFHQNRSTFSGDETGPEFSAVITAWNDWQMAQEVMDLGEAERATTNDTGKP